MDEQDKNENLPKCFSDESRDYVQRIPDPTIAGFAACLAAFFEPLNNIRRIENERTEQQ